MEQEHILNTHIDTLTEWWDSAEQGIPSAGDTVIFDERHRGHGFYVYQATKDHPHGYDNIRILHRAPAPTPAWHDAVAVIAQTPGRDDRRVFIRDTDGWWADVDNSYEKDELSDVTTLIEQKVTDEMADRLRDAVSDHSGKVSRDDIRAWVRAALGLDPA